MEMPVMETPVAETSMAEMPVAAASPSECEWYLQRGLHGER